MVVGAGPAGLSAAAELPGCLVLEQGRAHDRRDRQRDVLAGIGGAGLFSDGKHSFFPAATALWTLPGPELLAAAVDRTTALLARHGLVAPASGPAVAAPASGDWQLKPYPSVYMPLERRMDVIAELGRVGGERWTDAHVVAARRDGPMLELQVARGGRRVDVRARALIVATGRLSPRWVRSWLADLDVRFAFRRLQFGVRLELAADAPLFERLVGVDPKLRLALDDATELRTFCTCRDGEVVCGEAGGIAAWSGRADGPPTGRSSVGLLVRTTDEALARAVAPALFAARPSSVPLAAADLSTLRPIFGERGAALVLHAIDRLLELCPDTRHDPRAVIHAPCIEGVGDYPVDDGALQVAPGVWVAGDLCGRFRGIVAGMVSGRYAALRLLRATR